MRYFNHSGHVLAMDADEDFAMDMVHRMRDLPPFSSMASVAREVVIGGIGNSASEGNASSAWNASTHCQPHGHNVFAVLESEGDYDHYCRISRQRAELRS
jgi:hypothetical protein